MTKFITYYNLFPIPDPREFLGIADDCEDGNIITTLARNIVVILKLSTQKQIRSWSTLEKLSSKVVYDRGSQQYVGVFANQALRLWTIDTPDLNKIKKLKFQKSISEVISNDNETLILYNDGTCEPLERALESRKDQRETSATEQKALASNQTLSNASVNSLPNGQKMLTYFKRNNKTGELNLVRLILRNRKITVFPIKRENVKIAGYAVTSGDTAPMLLTIWSDKRIFLLSLAVEVTADRAPGNFVSMLTELNLEQNISLLGISPHFVAIYGANHGQEGASLLLYNTQFKVAKAKQFFKVYFNFSRLWATDEQIILAMGQNISVVTYRMSKELLAELLGTQNSDEHLTAIELDHINEEEALDQCIKYIEGSHPLTGTAFNGTEDEIQSLPSKEADGKTVPFEAVHEFDKKLSSLSRLHIHAEVLEVEQSPEETQLLLMSNHSDMGSRHALVQQIARQMERCGASEHEISEKLLTVLIKADQPELVLETVQRYANISEKVLACTLSYVLKKSLSVNSLKKKSNHKLTNGNGNSVNDDITQMDVDVAEPTSEYPIVDILAQRHSESSPQLLNALLACNFDPEAIAEHLRSALDYSEALYLLQYLYDIITDAESALEGHNCYIPDCVQTELKVLSWFGVIMNSHFQKLALAKDLELVDLLLKWQLVFHEYRNELGNLEQVAARLYDIVQRRRIQNENNFSKWYSIEEVVLY